MTSLPGRTEIVSQIIDSIQSVVGTGPVMLHEPSFHGNEWKYLKECLDSTFVSSVGKFVDLFESNLATFTGAKHAVAMVNGTSALHIALKLVGVSLNNEVLVPALSFIATANAVSYCGAIPHFVESEEYTLGVSSKALRDYLEVITSMDAGHCINKKTGRIIKALVPMHTFGHPVDIEGLLAIARDYNLVLIEDAAESLGSYVQGRHTGTFGEMGVLSFNGNKTITTGGGGALLTNDSILAKRAKHLTTTAKIPHRWEYQHDEVGYNYRLPNINAALGCAQLEELPHFLESKRKLYHKYKMAFSHLDQVSLMTEPKTCSSNYWLQTLILNKSISNYRDTILQATNDAGFMTRPVWTLMHHLPLYASCPRMNLSVAESLEQRLINLPSSAHLVKEGAL